MRRFLAHWPVHSFLVGIYIISFIFLKNLDQVTLAMTARSIGVCLLVTVLLFGAGFLCYRSVRKAGILVTLLVIGFFTYGFVYDGLEGLFYKGLWPFAHIHRFLLVAYFGLLVLLFILLYRSRRQHTAATWFLNVFVLVLFVLNSLSSLVFKKQVAAPHRKNPFLAAYGQNIKDTTNRSASPDVYYIVLDGYAGEKTLHQFYGDRAPALYRFLRQKNFYVADSSATNYPATAPSLSSSLNMNFIQPADNPFELVRQNLVSYIFKQNGYRVVNMKTGFAVSGTFAFADKTFKIDGFNEFERRLLELTILRLDDVLGFSRYKQLHSQLDELSLVTQERGPKFSFIHIVAPHPPYVVDSAGNRKVRTSLSDMAWEPRVDYKGQMDYVSRRIMTFIDQILATSIDPIIIVQSDHGPWISDGNAKHVYAARTKILNAYYVPGSIKGRLYSNISPVNSFRLITSELFHLNYPLLPDQPVPFAQIEKEITFKKYAD